MAKREHLKILKQGTEVWNQWRNQNREIVPDLTGAKPGRVNLIGADLSGADLSHADLYDANMSRADLSHANLIRANLLWLETVRFGPVRPGKYKEHKADLKGANLREADLRGANLRNINLSETILIGANLNATNLKGANLSGADLSEAFVRWTDLSGADLNGADLSGVTMIGNIIAKTDLHTTKGLATIRHQGPSRIEIFSIQLPQDGSALHFLRGTGVPDEWIDIYRTMMMHPIQYHSCFISYSSVDETLAKRLHADLQAQGVRCWFAPHDMRIGDKIRPRIDEAIYLHDKLLLLLSAHALASDWVEDEVETAYEKEAHQKREVLFPIRLDDSVMQTSQAWAAKLRRTRHIGDFTRWSNPNSYRQSFERLVKDLKKTVSEQIRNEPELSDEEVK